MQSDQLSGTAVLLTGPDGQEHSFTCGAVIPLHGRSYVILHGTEQYEGQMLITTLVKGEDGSLAFEMVEDEKTLEDVLGTYVASSIRNTLESDPAEETLDESAIQQSAIVFFER